MASQDPECRRRGNSSDGSAEKHLMESAGLLDGHRCAIKGTSPGAKLQHMQGADTLKPVQGQKSAHAHPGYS